MVYLKPNVPLKREEAARETGCQPGGSWGSLLTHDLLPFPTNKASDKLTIKSIPCQAIKVKPQYIFQKVKDFCCNPDKCVP